MNRPAVTTAKPTAPKLNRSKSLCRGTSRTICEAARDARRRHSRAAASLEAQCNPPVKLGRVETPPTADPRSICDAARDALTRKSPAAASLLAQCRASGGMPFPPKVESPIVPIVQGRTFAPPRFEDGFYLWSCASSEEKNCDFGRGVFTPPAGGAAAGNAFCKMWKYSGVELSDDGQPKLKIEVMFGLAEPRRARTVNGEVCPPQQAQVGACNTIQELRCAPERCTKRPLERFAVVSRDRTRTPASTIATPPRPAGMPRQPLEYPWTLVGRIVVGDGVHHLSEPCSGIYRQSNAAGILAKWIDGLTHAKQIADYIPGRAGWSITHATAW